MTKFAGGACPKAGHIDPKQDPKGLKPFRRKSGRVLSLLASAVIFSPFAVDGVPASAAPTASSAALHAIAWTPCNKVFFCASVGVPLDYEQPTGEQISLALIKSPATDAAHRIGSLFVNPGGPGESGVDTVLHPDNPSFPPELQAQFDIVGFDPRGIGRSTPLRCFDTEDEASAALAPFPYPNSPQKQGTWIAGEHKLDAACASRGGAILNHMSTANTARDLDLLRQAVGDSGLTYYGISYGSFLGATYANLFPGKVRSIAIDGVIDPVAWTSGHGAEGLVVPFSTRLHAAAGAKATLNEFFRLCDSGGQNCKFAPHSASSYASLLRTLKDHPLLVVGPGATTFRYDESFLVADTLSAMHYSPTWPGFASLLADLEKPASPAELASRLSVLHSQIHAEDTDNVTEGRPGVSCSDSVNPTTYPAWSRDATSSALSEGLFGPYWTWDSSICADWPGHDSDRYLGPFNHRTSNPVLMVGNQFDPATPYPGAAAAAALMPNSSLLTVHGWGHTSVHLSTCADEAIVRYLLTSQTPPRGTVCQQDNVPFTHPTPQS